MIQNKRHLLCTLCEYALIISPFWKGEWRRVTFLTPFKSTVTKLSPGFWNWSAPHPVTGPFLYVPMNSASFHYTHNSSDELSVPGSFHSFHKSFRFIHVIAVSRVFHSQKLDSNSVQTPSHTHTHTSSRFLYLLVQWWTCQQSHFLVAMNSGTNEHRAEVSLRCRCHLFDFTDESNGTSILETFFLSTLCPVFKNGYALHIFTSSVQGFSFLPVTAGYLFSVWR